MKSVIIALRVLEFLFTVILLALIGDVIAIATGGNPSTVNYVMFTAVFSMLSLVYLLPSSFKDSFYIPIISIVLDGLNTLFFFCASIALAARLGVHSCTNSSYIKSNPITNGSVQMTKRCREAQAADAFLFFTWFAYIASFVISLLGGRSSSDLTSRTVRRPGMSQV